jgi:hypothetical protein
MEPSAVLDLFEWETVGALHLDIDIDFPVFAEKGPDQFMYCGVYRLGEWDMLPLEEWKRLDPKIQSYWARQIIAGSSDTGEQYLEDMGLLPPAHRKCTEDEVLDFFGHNLIRKKKALRLSRTGLAPVRYEADIYEALCATAGYSVTGLPSSPQILRKRPRIEDQPADHNAITFPLSQPRKSRPRRSQATPQYDLAERSRNSVAGANIEDTGDEDDGAAFSTAVGSEEIAALIVFSDESEEE